MTTRESLNVLALYDPINLDKSGPDRAASESGIGDSVIRVNWQIEDGKEDSSLFSCESILFSLPRRRRPRRRRPTRRRRRPYYPQRRQGLRVVVVSSIRKQQKKACFRFLDGIWAYLRERVMNRTRNRSKNLLIRIGIELFYFSSEAALPKSKRFNLN